MHEVDFQVYPDEVVALVGGNGAGKSTLLEHLNATLVPDDGELVVDGTPITDDDLARARSAVGFVFQDADTQLVAPTVLDDVRFGLQNYGVPAEEATERAREALATVDASHLEDRIPHYLSGGEKRLVGLAGVLVLEPSVIVLDEPLAGLDPARSRLVADHVERIHEEGISVVLSTHDLEFAAAVADRICVMSDGDVVGQGTPREVFYDPELLDAANLHPPSAVRVARDTGLDVDGRPVTEAELVQALAGSQSEPPQTRRVDGPGAD
ncbi:ATP-binding cassette domain-containing protein [Halorientalis pallida]|uniref:ATP-binding cassette domain-containing protein n=2 Tax=Halorientalis pallida TaxID=2479928 RepID=A0A498L5Q5_9EURY|nr:ATP-binding cassette domain-containing protein [Halorientalis pallida]